jgi:hypothetical protein
VWHLTGGSGRVANRLAGLGAKFAIRDRLRGERQAALLCELFTS